MSTYRPTPWLVPPPDGVHRPISVQVNISLPPEANNVDKGELMKVSEGIIAAQTAHINRFINNGRQQHTLSGRVYDDRSMLLDNLAARWQINGGQEKLTLEVFPVGGGPGMAQTSDTNLDGYVAWVHGEPGGPLGASSNGVTSDVTPYNVFMNGYLIEQNYAPTLPTGGYVMLFGKTAMLEPSYVGDKEHIKLDGPKKQRDLVIPPLGWGEYPAGSNGATFQEAYGKTFGYWILDWTNPLNPCQYFDMGGGSVQNWLGITTGFPALGKPQFTKGIYFSDPTKSPLKPRGKNGVGVFISPLSPYFGQGAEIVLIDVMIAEFYDRGAYRKATQSWTVTPKPRQVVAVNDKPMLFGTGSWTGGFSAGTGIEFDLAAATTKEFRSTNAAVFETTSQMGAHDYLHNVFQGHSPLVGLTSQQQDAFSAWAKQVQDAGKAYNDMITSQLKAWLNKWQQPDNMKLINQAQNVESWFYPKTDDQGNRIVKGPNPLDLVSADYLPSHDSTQVITLYGPVQEYWWDWNHPIPPATLVVRAARYSADAPFGALIVVDTLSNPGSPQAQDYGGSFAGTAPTMSIADLWTWAKGYIPTDALQQKNKEYTAIISQKPNPIETGPPLGDPLSGFRYSNINIAGTTWSYNQKP